MPERSNVMNQTQKDILVHSAGWVWGSRFHTVKSLTVEKLPTVAACREVAEKDKV